MPARVYRGLVVSAFAVLLALPASGSRAEESFSVGFLNPTIESNSPFYNLVQRIFHAAAQDLNIDIHVVYGNNSAIRMRRTGLKLMEMVKPDYFLTGYTPDATDIHLNYTLTHPVQVFMTIAAPSAKEQAKIGLPRGQYQNWIGQLTANDEEYGYIEANHLIDMAQQSGLTDDKGRVNIIAFGGFNEDTVSDARIHGLKRSVAEHDNAALLETTLAGWNPDLAYKYTLKKLKDNPSTQVIWATNDDMAIACIKAAEDAGRKPGQDILIGGIDLDSDAVDAIESGKLAVSVGGQFMEAAWSLAMLYDYHHGIDFDSETRYVYHSEPHVVTKQNAAEFKKYFLPDDWNDIDFKHLTKKHNPDIKEYDFSLEAVQTILEQQKEQPEQ
jgi:ABC-type sugar transport system substrate-binding protein